MIPRTGSYGETPTVTRSPGTTLMRKRRIRPLSWASTSCPASHCTRYSPPLCTATTVPCISMRSSLLNCLHVLSFNQTLCHNRQRFDRSLHRSGEELVIVADQTQGGAEGHAH